MRRHAILATGLLLAALATQPSAVAAATTDAPRTVEITADLDGVSIPATEAGRYFCHDFEYPHLRCFSTAAALDALEIRGIGDDLREEM